MIALVNGQFYGAKHDLDDGQAEWGLVIDGNRIVDLCPANKIDKRIQRIDMEGCVVVPGFIDLLVNGAGGGAFGVTAHYDDLVQMSNTLMAGGTTGFLAAAPSTTHDVYAQMLDALRAHQDSLPANFLGMHLEGPYLSMENRGAHRADCVRDCTDDELTALIRDNEHFVRMMTVAPERINASQVSYLQQHDVKVSFGHSVADYDTTLHFLADTGCSVTHIYNGMPPMHHRKPGHIPAIFHAKPMTGIILDGYHVSYPMALMAYDIMATSLYLFTDSFTECSAMDVTHDDQHDYFVRITPDGTHVMCGSALTMLKAVRNCVEHLHISLSESVRMASFAPAKILGIDHEVGLMHPGYLANLVAIDENWHVKKVMFNGNWVSL